MGNKKNIFIGLSTLLLVLLLGLSTTSYADTYRDFSKEDLQNYIYNTFKIRGFTNEQAETYTNQFSETELTEIATSLNSYDYVLIGSTTSYINIRASNTNNTTSSTTYLKTGDTQIINPNSSYYTYGKSLNINQNSSSLGTITNATSSTVSLMKQTNSSLTNIYYSSYNIYRSTTGTNSIGTPPLYAPNSDIFSGIYQPAPSHAEIIFTPIPKVQDVYVGQNLDIYTYGVNQNNTYRSMKFGDLYVPSGYYITRVDSTYLYFERASETWKEKILLQEVGTDLTLSNYSRTITNFKWENYDSSTYTIDYSAWINREYLHANCMYTFTFSGYYIDESEPFYIEYIFYIIDGNTVLTGTLGDELDPSFLVTGPYADEYAGDIDDLNDKVDENADLVDAIGQGIGGTLLPASGDWFPLNNLASGDNILGTAQVWGFRNYTNVYWNGIYQLLTNTFTILGQTGSVELDVSFHGYHKVISSNDIASPPSAIKDFISLCMVTFTMIAIYRHFSKKIENIQAADTSKIKHEADDSNLM